MGWLVATVGDSLNPFVAAKWICKCHFGYILALWIQGLARLALTICFGFVIAFTLGLDQPRVPQDLEVLRDVGHGHAGLRRELIHVAGALGQEVDELQPLVAGERGADARELRV